MAKKTFLNISAYPFIIKRHIDWKGPVVSKADTLLSLDRNYCGRKKLSFKSCNTEFTLKQRKTKKRNPPVQNFLKSN